MVDGSQKANNLKEHEKIELLYRNLEFISKAYYSAEGVFPFWESAYALIVGQLLIAYFQKETNLISNFIMVGAGLIFSFFWYRLVSLNRQHAIYLDNTMKHLEFKLIQEYYKNELTFYTESPPENFSSYGNKVKYFKFNTGLFAELLPKGSARKSTWYFRRILPLSLIFLWVILLVLLLINIYYLKVSPCLLECVTDKAQDLL